MKKFLLCLVALVFVSDTVCEAKVFGRRRSTGGSYANSSGVDTSCAQGVANAMAERHWVGHFGLGGTGLFEGCAMASTKQAAYNNCCFARSGMKTVDVGYAQGKNGMWFCCRRYQP